MNAHQRRKWQRSHPRIRISDYVTVSMGPLAIAPPPKALMAEQIFSDSSMCADCGRAFSRFQGCINCFRSHVRKTMEDALLVIINDAIDAARKSAEGGVR